MRAWLKDAKRVTIIGVGNPLRHDDSLGICVINALDRTSPKNVQLLIAEGIPEDEIPKIESFGPTHVIVIDAAIMARPLGNITFTTSLEMSTISVSTHTLPIGLFVVYLEQVLHARVALILIEAKDVSFGEGISPELHKIVDEVAEALQDAILSRND